MSLRDLLGVSTWDSATAVLRKEYLTNPAEEARRKIGRERQAFYRDAGDDIMWNYIRKVFDDPEVQRLRKVFIPEAKYNNVVKNVARLLATLYTVPPTRRVGGGATNNANYARVVRDSLQNQYMLRLNRYLMVHRQVAVGFRVWEDELGNRNKQIHLVTPDNFYAIHHPSDPLWLIGFIVDQQPTTFDSDLVFANMAESRYLVWTNTEMFHLTRSGHMVEQTPIEHGFDRMPWLLASIEPPDTQLLDTTEGSDLVAAQKAVWFLNILHLKESKSANKQTAFTGDISSTPTGQSADSDVDLVLGDGVSTQTIDRGVDLNRYRLAADNVLERAAANYGIPPSVLKHQGATSGFEIKLRRIGIQERRQEQEPVFRDLERELAEVEAMVVQKDAKSDAFSVESGWNINFGDTQTLLDEETSLRVFETKKRLGLTNTLEYFRENDPDLTPGDALDKLIDNIAQELIRNREMRPLQAISGSMGASTPGTNDSETNRGIPGNATRAEIAA